jgi:hypothetical protein
MKGLIRKEEFAGGSNELPKFSKILDIIQLMSEHVALIRSHMHAACPGPGHSN